MFGKPRLVTLLEVASRAELLRRRRQVRGYALRAGLGVAAAVFGLLLLVWLHLTAWQALAGPLGPVGAALVMVVLDLVVLLVLGQLATRGRTDATADEAIAVRDRALRARRWSWRPWAGWCAAPRTNCPPSACAFIRREPGRPVSLIRAQDARRRSRCRSAHGWRRRRWRLRSRRSCPC